MSMVYCVQEQCILTPEIIIARCFVSNELILSSPESHVRENLFALTSPKDKYIELENSF